MATAPCLAQPAPEYSGDSDRLALPIINAYGLGRFWKSICVGVLLMVGLVLAALVWSSVDNTNVAIVAHVILISLAGTAFIFAVLIARVLPKIEWRVQTLCELVGRAQCDRLNCDAPSDAGLFDGITYLSERQRIQILVHEGQQKAKDVVRIGDRILKNLKESHASHSSVNPALALQDYGEWKKKLKLAVAGLIGMSEEIPQQILVESKRATKLQQTDDASTPPVDIPRSHDRCGKACFWVSIGVVVAFAVGVPLYLALRSGIRSTDTAIAAHTVVICMAVAVLPVTIQVASKTSISEQLVKTIHKVVVDAQLDHIAAHKFNQNYTSFAALRESKRMFSEAVHKAEEAAESGKRVSSHLESVRERGDVALVGLRDSVEKFDLVIKQCRTFQEKISKGMTAAELREKDVADYAKGDGHSPPLSEPAKQDLESSRSSGSSHGASGEHEDRKKQLANIRLDGLLDKKAIEERLAREGCDKRAIENMFRVMEVHPEFADLVQQKMIEANMKEALDTIHEMRKWYGRFTSEQDLAALKMATSAMDGLWQLHVSCSKHGVEVIKSSWLRFREADLKAQYDAAAEMLSEANGRDLCCDRLVTLATQFTNRFDPAASGSAAESKAEVMLIRQLMTTICDLRAKHNMGRISTRPSSTPMDILWCEMIDVHNHLHKTAQSIYRVYRDSPQLNQLEDEMNMILAQMEHLHEQVSQLRKRVADEDQAAARLEHEQAELEQQIKHVKSRRNDFARQDRLVEVVQSTANRYVKMNRDQVGKQQQAWSELLVSRLSELDRVLTSERAVLETRRNYEIEQVTTLFSNLGCCLREANEAVESCESKIRQLGREQKQTNEEALCTVRILEIQGKAAAVERCVRQMEDDKATALEAFDKSHQEQRIVLELRTKAEMQVAEEAQKALNSARAEVVLGMLEEFHNEGGKPPGPEVMQKFDQVLKEEVKQLETSASSMAHQLNEARKNADRLGFDIRSLQEELDQAKEIRTELEVKHQMARQKRDAKFSGERKQIVQAIQKFFVVLPATPRMLTKDDMSVISTTEHLRVARNIIREVNDMRSLAIEFAGTGNIGVAFKKNLNKEDKVSLEENIDQVRKHCKELLTWILNRNNQCGFKMQTDSTLEALYEKVAWFANLKEASSVNERVSDAVMEAALESLKHIKAQHSLVGGALTLPLLSHLGPHKPP